MQRLWMIGLSLALATGFVHAQQATQPTDANVPVPSDQFSSKKINPPYPLNQVEAEFSAEARAKGINGLCLVSVTVGVNGLPQEVKLVRCTDSAFEKSSLSAASKYRFKPATTKDGKPVSSTISVEVNYRLNNSNNPIPMPVRWGFSSPPGITTADPGADGVYPLTMKSVPPVMTRYVDSGYGIAAFLSPKGNDACDVVLTISTNGKASGPKVTHCERPNLEKPAVESLLNSKYKPGSVNGVEVPMRVSIHLEYGGDAAK
jgi:TonB family protein